MQTFITEAPAAIAMFDRNMRYIAVSKRWVSDFQLEGQDLVGRSHYEVFPELPQKWKEIHQRCLAGGVEKQDEELFVRGDGSRQWLSWEVRPWMLNADGGEIGGILIFSEDITAMKEAYEQESAMRARAEVAMALQAEAEKLAKAKDEFVATLSHELRTPLNAMLGWTQLLKKFSADPYRLVQAMNAIERSGQALTQLISDILDINRIASGKLRLQVAAVSVRGLIESALDAVGPELAAKELTLEKCLDVESLSISGDSVRLHQCLWNLLSNAIKFTPRGGRITVSATVSEKLLRISVADTGCGIRPEVLPRIFERFVQGDTSSTRAHGGLGLGLAIVRHLVELHGGSVAAHSDGLGQGSVFTISLPLMCSVAAPPSITEVRDALGDGIDLSRRSILVVDDQLEARELLRGALEDCGARVYTAPSAESGFEIADHKHPDLVISDVAMPERDGCEFIGDIRAAGITTPAIALSAHAAPADAERALAAGFNRYLAKPVRLDQLFAALRELL